MCRRWTLYLVYPKHASTPIVPQAADFAEWWSSLEAMLLLSFVGQPFDLNYNPVGFAQLGDMQRLSMAGACASLVGALYNCPLQIHLLSLLLFYPPLPYAPTVLTDLLPHPFHPPSTHLPPSPPPLQPSP